MSVEEKTPATPARKKSLGKRFRHWLLDSWPVFALFRTFVWFMAILPRSVSQLIGRMGGRFAYWLDRGHREVCYSNLQIAFPEKSLAEKRAILKACYSHLGRCAADFCVLSRVSREFLTNEMIVPDPGLRELVEACHNEGKGIIALAAHIGFWELSGYASKLYGFELVSVSRRIPSPRFEAFVTRVRERMGNKMVNQEGALRAILRQLKENRGAGILMDLYGGRDSPWIPFFGKEASTFDTAGRLYVKSRVPVVLGLMLRRPDGRYRFSLTRIQPEVSGSEEEQIRQMLTAINAEMERVIREHPEQWLWMHKRWRGAEQKGARGKEEKGRKREGGKG